MFDGNGAHPKQAQIRRVITRKWLESQMFFNCSKAFFSIQFSKGQKFNQRFNFKNGFFN